MAQIGQIFPTNKINDDTISKISGTVSYEDGTWGSISASVDSKGNVYSNGESGVIGDISSIIELMLTEAGAIVTIPQDDTLNKSINTINAEVSIQYTSESEQGSKSLEIQYTDEKELGITITGDGTWNEAYAAESESLTSLFEALFPNIVFSEQVTYLATYLVEVAPTINSSIILDESGNGRNAALRDSGALYFDGANDYLVIPNSNDFQNEISWEFSCDGVYYDASLASAVLLSQEIGNGTFNLRWIYYQDGGTNAGWHTNLTNGELSNSNDIHFDQLPTLTPGTPFSLSLRRSGSNLTLTVNSISQTITSFAPESADGNFALASDYSYGLDREFEGDLWNVRFDHPNGWYYPFAESFGPMVFDVGPNGNHIDYSAVPSTRQPRWVQQNDWHYNLTQGHTIYERTEFGRILVPHNISKQEITGFTPPTGYARVADYPAGIGHNNCETTIDFAAWGPAEGIILPSAYRFGDYWEYEITRSSTLESDFLVPEE